MDADAAFTLCTTLNAADAMGADRLDAVGGFIEWDVQLPEGGAVEGIDKWTRLAATGPIDARCPQTEPLRMIKCLGHLHIGKAPLLSLCQLPCCLLPCCAE